MSITSYLQGGLGNQMFQYAIARSLSNYYEVDFSLDCSWFKNIRDGVTPRKLELIYLNIDQSVFNDGPGLNGTKKLSLAAKYYLPFGPIIKKQKNAYDFDEDLFLLKRLKKRDLFLYGYWQSYRYFSGIKEILKIDFSPKTSPPQDYEKFQRKIQSTNSVMLHIRRGDYVNSPSASKFHGALSIEYYLLAINSIQKLMGDVHFFIFSDDLDWAKSALPKNLQSTFIEPQISDESSIHELSLMTHCKHHIIANSSYSWWGAWLKKNNSGIIYAPNRWTNTRNLDLSNLLPHGWIRLNS